MRFLNEIVFNAADSSSSQTSSAIDTSMVTNLSVQAVFTDAASAGTLKVQASNDHTSYGNLPFVPTNWTDISGASVSVTAGGSVIIPTVNICYQFVRIIFTRSAGAGTISANVKTIGF